MNHRTSLRAVTCLLGSLLAACGGSAVDDAAVDASSDHATDAQTPDDVTDASSDALQDVGATDGVADVPATDVPASDATPGTCGTMRPDITGISNTEGLVIGPDGTIYYSQPGGVGRLVPGGTPENDWVREVGPATGTVWGLALDTAHQRLYVASPTAHRIYRVDLTAATPVATILTFPAGSPNGMTIGPDGALYYSDFAGGQVHRVADDTTPTQVTTSTITQANGIAFATDGSLYVDNYSAGTLTRLVLSGGTETSRTVVATGLGHPDGLAFDATGAIYVTDQGSGGLIRLDPDGMHPTTRRPGISSPANIEFGAGALNCHDVYVASGGRLVRDETGTVAGADVPWHR